MDDSKTFASLSSALLARKGGARPSSRPGLVYEEPEIDDADHSHQAEIVPISRASEVQANEARRQQDRLSGSFPDSSSRSLRRSAFERGAKAAFTLRLDEDRHLRLRLACTASNRSAQQVVTEALDRLLSDLPDLDVIANEFRRKRSF